MIILNNYFSLSFNNLYLIQGIFNSFFWHQNSPQIKSTFGSFSAVVLNDLNTIFFSY